MPNMSFPFFQEKSKKLKCGFYIEKFTINKVRSSYKSIIALKSLLNTVIITNMNSKSFTLVILLMFCLYSRVNSSIISDDSHCWHGESLESLTNIILVLLIILFCTFIESGDLEPKITNVA